MRTIAEALFWVGRLGTVMVAVIVAHWLIICHWRHSLLKQCLGVGWLLLFVGCSIWSLVDGPPLLQKTVDGTSHIMHDLYSGSLTDEEALSMMRSRWQRVWLPNYAVWLAVWIVGLLSIDITARLRERVLRLGQVLTS